MFTKTGFRATRLNVPFPFHSLNVYQSLGFSVEKVLPLMIRHRDDKRPHGSSSLHVPACSGITASTMLQGSLVAPLGKKTSEVRTLRKRITRLEKALPTRKPDLSADTPPHSRYRHDYHD